MASAQDTFPRGTFTLRTERLGPLPIVNCFLDRIGLEGVLDKYVPTHDRRVGFPYARGLGVLLRSIIVEREPIYRQQETVRSFAPAMCGLGPDSVDKLGDDRIGRALDRLFDADRAAILTETVVAVGKRFGLRSEELHNDTTTIRLCGQYRLARGRHSFTRKGNCGR